MKTVISILNTLYYITTFSCVVILIIGFTKRYFFNYHPSVRDYEMDKTYRLFKTGGILMIICMMISGIKTQLIKKDFEECLHESKINFVEVNGSYFSQYDTKGLFDTFEYHSGRDKCEKFQGLINLENGKNIPITVVKHCYDKNKYIIISKAYGSETIIGEITTDKFNQLTVDSIDVQE